MKAYLKVFVLAFIYFYLDYTGIKAEDITSEQQVKVGFDLYKLKSLWSSLTLNQAEPFADNLFVRTYNDLGYQEGTFQVTDQKHCQITFLQRDKTIIGFIDDGIFNQLYNPPNAPLYDVPDKPQWTSEQAAAEGKKVLDILVSGKKCYFLPPTAKFIHTKNGGKYYAGQWEITWQRIDSKGHLFDAQERVAVYISESKGPFHGGVSLTAHYEEPTGELLKAADLEQKAWEKAQAVVVWPPVKSFLEPEAHLDSKPFRTELRIVKPNNMLKGDTISTHDNLNARLAWIFWYAWKFDDGSKQGQSIGVWIDAYTGEMLGGDVGM